ncbi:MAG: tetratricopeptide repeat protein [Chloroflexi bacterium]|nr:tetratricopeptide repeat protein [Chloroflexota bacterium]
MAIFQSEERQRAKRQKIEKAINLAMLSRWSEAAELNRELIKDYPNEPEAYNRLGKALMELGRYREARDAYAEALRVDPMNTIAQKNLAKLTKLVEDEEAGTAVTLTTGPVDPSLFIEETGKTAQTSLVDLAPADVRAPLNPGDVVTLEVQGNSVRVLGPNNEYLGRLEPKLGQRVLRLLELGNQYTATVTAADDTTLRIIIRETYRAPAMGDRPSFPTAAEAFRAYTRDTVIRYDTEEEEEEAYEEAEVEPDIAAEAELDLETPLEEPDFAEEQ